MSISFASYTGGLMNVLGKVGAVIKNLRAHQTTQDAAMSDQSTGIVGQLNAEPDVQAITGAGYLAALSSLGGSVGSLMQQQADAALNRAVYRDNPRQGQTLTTPATLASLQEMIRQMQAQGATFLAPTVAAAGTAFTGTGDGVINASVKRPFDGKQLDYAFQENLNLICSADSYSGGATAGNETFTVTGTGAEPDVFAFDWPRGSDAQAQLTAIDGAQSNAGGNYLTNSGFDAFTSNVPDNWELDTGTAGVDVFKDTGITFGGAASLKLVGDGATQVTLSQQFDADAGTSGSLTALSQYSFCGWLRRDGVAPAAGALEVALVDENGTVVQDADGTENKGTVDLTALTVQYAPYRFVFRTPASMPEELHLRLKLTTALTTGRAVYLDLFSLGDMTQLYAPHGPYAAVHAGAVPFVLNDYAQVQVTNSRGAGGTLDTFPTLMYRLFAPVFQSEELLFPTSSSPSVDDALIS